MDTGIDSLLNNSPDRTEWNNVKNSMKDWQIHFDFFQCASFLKTEVPDRKKLSKLGIFLTNGLQRIVKNVAGSGNLASSQNKSNNNKQFTKK